MFFEYPNLTSLNIIEPFALFLLITLVTLYGFESKKLGVITILILAISCIASLYADFVITNEESKNGKAILYMYTATTNGETWWKPVENPELFPVVKIIAGEVSKEFKA